MRGFKQDRSLPLLLAVAGFYAFLEFVCGITCPIRFLTGISCPGCGMSRACMAVLRLDLKTAVYFHPLFWLPALWLPCFLARRRFPFLYKSACSLAVLLLLAVYVYRMACGGQDIVVFDPKNGIIGRLLQYLVRSAQ